MNQENFSPLALLSVSDKYGLVSLSRTLKERFGFRLVSSGGTYDLLRENDVQSEKVEELTEFPEILGGRVKTLHPLVHGGILADRLSASHMSDVQGHSISLIDIVVVNFYPFRETIADLSSSHQEAIEHIDIGGVALVRAAAKNYKNVLVVVDPSDYELLLCQLGQPDGPDLSFRLELAKKAFRLVADYDRAISDYFSRFYQALSEDKGAPCFSFDSHLTLTLEKSRDLRYGENAHQKAALYFSPHFRELGVAQSFQIQGKHLSYNNFVDADAAWSCVSSFQEEPACAIVKHANPCGIAVAENIYDAYHKALRCDPLSSFGGIVAFNREVDEKTADDVLSLFVEVVLAPSFTEAAKQAFLRKPNVRVLLMPVSSSTQEWECRRVGGGLLIQEFDSRVVSFEACRVVTERQPTKSQQRDLIFAWRAVRHVKSNAIIFCSQGASVGIGAGQMSRVDAVDLAISKALDRGLTLSDSVVASDAFFPFPDSIERIASVGAVAIIQPGGSVRDQEVIDEANCYGLTMAFTGVRHFRH